MALAVGLWQHGYLWGQGGRRSQRGLMGLEVARRRAEVVLSKQKHLPRYRMKIVKARIGQRQKVGMAFVLDSNHQYVVSG